MLPLLCVCESVSFLYLGPILWNYQISAINHVLFYLFRKGCDVNHVVENKCRFYQRGTALKMASERGCCLIVELLLQSGANPDLTGNIHSPPKETQHLFQVSPRPQKGQRPQGVKRLLPGVVSLVLSHRSSLNSRWFRNGRQNAESMHAKNPKIPLTSFWPYGVVDPKLQIYIGGPSRAANKATCFKLLKSEHFATLGTRLEQSSLLIRA